MPGVKKILWVKFGWSEFYRGGPVDGNFGWLNDHKDTENAGRGHEAFNFAPDPDGVYHCYVPPQGKRHAPSCEDDPKGWTVICLAKRPRQTGIHVVGWYENATLHGDWFPPPANMVSRRGDTSHPAYDWSYCISGKTAYFVPLAHRTIPFSDPAVRQGKYSFLSGSDVLSNVNKRRVLAILENRIAALAPFAIKNPNARKLPDPEIDSDDPLIGFGTAEHRRRVEIAAEREVVAYFGKKGYAPTRVAHIPCGYDYIFTKGRSAIHVEVKGTASSIPQFFLTRNEHQRGLRDNPNWVLAMVTSALSANPVVKEYRARDLATAFDIHPYVFLGRSRQ